MVKAPLYVLTHGLVILLLLVSLWAAGGLLVRRLGGDALLRFAFGCLVVVGALFLLATIGLYSPAPMIAVVTALSVLGILATPPAAPCWKAGERSSRKEQPTRQPQADEPESDRLHGASEIDNRLASRLLVLVLVTTGSVLLVDALTPTIAWDSDVYHLTVPKLYLQQGGFWRIPYNVYSNWPISMELLYGLGLLRAPAVAKASHLTLGILATLVAFRMARSRGVAERSIMCGLVASLLFLSNPVVLQQIATAYVDCAYAFFFALAALALLDRLEQSEGEGRSSSPVFGIDERLVPIGLLAGMVASLKLNGFFAAFCLSILTFLTLRRRRLVSAATIAVVAFLVLLPWLIKTWILTGNPVYPLFYSVLGGPEWSELLSEKHAAWQRSIGMGRTLIDYLLLPLRVVLYGGDSYQNFNGAVSPVWLMLVPLSLLGAARDRRTRLLLALSGMYFVLWALTSQQLRFLIPVLPFLAAASARSLFELLSLVTRPLESNLRNRVRFGLTTLLALALSVHLIFASLPLYRQAPSVVRALVTQGAGLEELVQHPMYRFMNDNLPPDARVLMINHNRGFWLERSFLADSFFEASQIEHTLNWQTSRAEVETTLAELGVTHLLVQNVDRGLRFSEPLVQMLSDPEAARVVYRSPDGAYSVIELLPSGSLKSVIDDLQERPMNR